MYFDLTKIGIFFDSIVVVGLVTGFLLNLLFYVLKIKSNLSLVVTSGVVALSYLISNVYLDLVQADYTLYLMWFFYDLLTIALLIGINYKLKGPWCNALHYVFLFLTINSLLYLGLYIDLAIFETREEWWFWSVYSAAVLICDSMIVISLIIDKDWLSLIKLLRKAGFKVERANNN
ncbi:hypothetical protein CBQ28_12740 [Pseudoalteromonas sp. GCY]|uniref:hypothetical protein n=1 Tax=Pseudoalteromonas sp. GCY TaxID=2003316 RepID=UPI000BFF0A20|nr:hypothetical protein [Pseudoalteromonas sp. GCY]PHI36828.1 hypothetical protein CBQ28_12740 [Pseudoalteromonas sp. GCY]QQQ66810.1 hypothetical protein JJQ94_21580 [Pseudoalteromonas sp. GCY]